MKYLSLFILVFCPLVNAAFESVKLKDTIRQGYGEIDLFLAHLSDKKPTADALEWYRQDNEGHLVFAIDVNEPANGTEKSQSQGVTIKNVYLTVVSNGVTRQYSEFFTPTVCVIRL